MYVPEDETLHQEVEHPKGEFDGSTSRQTAQTKPYVLKKTIDLARPSARYDDAVASTCSPTSLPSSAHMTSWPGVLTGYMIRALNNRQNWRNIPPTNAVPHHGCVAYRPNRKGWIFRPEPSMVADRIGITPARFTKSPLFANMYDLSLSANYNRPLVPLASAPARRRAILRIPNKNRIGYETTPWRRLPCLGANGWAHADAPRYAGQQPQQVTDCATHRTDWGRNCRSWSRSSETTI